MIIKGLTDANVDVATVKPENFAAFNISDNHPIAVKQQQIRTTNVEITSQPTMPLWHLHSIKAVICLFTLLVIRNSILAMVHLKK